MIENQREEIEEDYQKTKHEFQKDILSSAYRIADEIKEYRDLFREVFEFLNSAFNGKLRNDKKTPLVFHSIYLVKLAYLYNERSLDTLLTIALHDVLEDTGVSEKDLKKMSFLAGRGYLVGYLNMLKENKDLSREPDGKNLPPRYAEHIRRLIGSPKEVIETELLDRFSDLMDLEYIINLPEDERNLRLKSKLIKVRGFVENITEGRDDFNLNFLRLFEEKAEDIETRWHIEVDVPQIKL